VTLDAFGEFHDMEVIGFCHGDPFGPHSWSGSNRGLFSALRGVGVLRAAVDVEVRGWQRYLAALGEYSPNKKTWKHNYLKSPHLFALRTKAAGRYLNQQERAPDAVLQTGAMFDATRAHRHLSRFCYLDSNCALSEKGGPQSFGHYATSEYKRMAHERERRIYHESAGIFVFSDFVRQSLLDDFDVPDNRIHTVYAGINLSALPKTPTRAREPLILFVGRDFERKGGAVLLRAFARVHARLPHARLVIAGCEPPVHQAGVEIAGFIDKTSADGEQRLAALFARAAVFTMPSHFEPFGIVYAEAMHFGLPCVGVRHCAMPEIISDGETGLLVPPDDDEALARALIRILEDRELAERMGRAAMVKAQERFRWDTVANKMVKVMRAVVAGGDSRAA
jgi:starch synthase